MTTVVISPVGVADNPDRGGHFCVYLQYVQGLRSVGCDVYWLEEVERPDDYASASFGRLLEHYGVSGPPLVYTRSAEGQLRFLGASDSEADAVLGEADLLLNFAYGLGGGLLARCRRTALVDIDPGLTQHWVRTGQITMSAHDCYLTTGETVGHAGSLIPGLGLRWHHIRPPVSLESWPLADDPPRETFTTVSSWWDEKAWVTDGDWSYDNNKRVAFLALVNLPLMTEQPLELALFLDTEGADNGDRQLLEQHGWRVRHAFDVAGTPARYRSYVCGSRGEFSCAKPSYRRLQSAWVSDRTVCYLASGRPVVVQDTGASSFLPSQGPGMFRFSTAREAVSAFATINADYAGQREAARALAARYFDARDIVSRILEVALS